jgi:HEAT repeat protein
MQRVLALETKALIESLHKKLSFWESSQEHKVRLLTLIGDTHDAAAIPDIASHLLDRNRAVAMAAASAVSALMATLQTSELPWLDQLMRERSQYRWSYPSAWAALKPGQVGRLRLLGESSVPFIGLASFHLSGYVRAEALRILAEAHDGTELPFLLLRLNDWVKPVREFARFFLDQRLVAAYAPFFVLNITLVDRLRFVQREQHLGAIDAIQQLLKSEATAVTSGLSSPDRAVKRICYEMYLGSTGSDCETLIVRALAEDDPAVRVQAAKAIASVQNKDRVESLMAAAMKDPFPAVRRWALRSSVDRFPNQAGPWLKKALLDSDGSVRGYGQFHIARILPMDLHEFYVRAVKNPEATRATAISGLGEVGTPADAEIVLPFVSNEVPKVRKAVIRALSNLDADHFADLFLKSLSDPSPGVSREAMKALSNCLYMTTGESLWNIVVSSSSIKVQRHALFLISRLSKWESISYLVEAVASNNEEMQSLAETYLRRWYHNFNSSFTSPTAEQVERLTSALQKAGRRMQGSLLAQIAHGLLKK